MMQGVFDLKTISMLQGSRIVDTVTNYTPYIKNIRQELRRPEIYSYLEALSQLLKAGGVMTASPEDSQRILMRIDR